MQHSKYMYKFIWEGGVRGDINKNITKYSRRHLSYFLHPTSLPCSLAGVLCSLFLRAVDPIHRSSCDDSLFKWKAENKKSLSWENAALCTVACVDMCVLLGALGLSGAWEDIHLFRWSLFKVGVVGKGIDILLDHFVAELVLLLRRKQHGNTCYLKTHLGRGWRTLLLML